MKKIIGIFLLLISFILCGCQEESKTRQTYAMNTIIEFTVYGEEAEAKIDKAIALVNRYDKLFSVNQLESDISKLNAAQGQAVTVSPDTYDLLKKSVVISEETQGALDVSIYPIVKAWGFTTDNYRVPDDSELETLKQKVDYHKIRFVSENTIQLEKGMVLDLGAIAKGYISQKIMDMWKREGVEKAILSLGGNVQTLGEKSEGEPFQIGIVNPASPSELYGTLEVKDCAVVTSGTYERYFEKDGVKYHHIMDYNTGKPVENDLASVTVVAKDGTTADGLSTALFVMGGEQAKKYQEEHDEIELILIYQDGTCWYSSGLNFYIR